MTATFSAPHFNDDEAAREFLERLLWPEGPVCRHCGTINHAYKTKRPGVYRCAEKGCRKDFSVTKGTVLERSHIALHKWLQAFYLVASSKKGISAHQLHRTLGIGYEAAWFMEHRIREVQKSHPWFARAVSDIRMLRIEEHNNLLPAIAQQDLFPEPPSGRDS